MVCDAGTPCIDRDQRTRIPSIPSPTIQRQENVMDAGVASDASAPSSFQVSSPTAVTTSPPLLHRLLHEASGPSSFATPHGAEKSIAFLSRVLETLSWNRDLQTRFLRAFLDHGGYEIHARLALHEGSLNNGFDIPPNTYLDIRGEIIKGKPDLRITVVDGDGNESYFIRRDTIGPIDVKIRGFRVTNNERGTHVDVLLTHLPTQDGETFALPSGTWFFSRDLLGRATDHMPSSITDIMNEILDYQGAHPQDPLIDLAHSRIELFAVSHDTQNILVDLPTEETGSAHGNIEFQGMHANLILEGDGHHGMSSHVRELWFENLSFANNPPLLGDDLPNDGDIHVEGLGIHHADLRIMLENTLHPAMGFRLESLDGIITMTNARAHNDLIFSQEHPVYNPYQIGTAVNLKVRRNENNLEFSGKISDGGALRYDIVLGGDLLQGHSLHSSAGRLALQGTRFKFYLTPDRFRNFLDGALHAFFPDRYPLRFMPRLLENISFDIDTHLAADTLAFEDTSHRREPALRGSVETTSLPVHASGSYDPRTEHGHLMLGIHEAQASGIRLPFLGVRHIDLNEAAVFASGNFRTLSGQVHASLEEGRVSLREPIHQINTTQFDLAATLNRGVFSSFLLTAPSAFVSADRTFPDAEGFDLERISAALSLGMRLRPRKNGLYTASADLQIHPIRFHLANGTLIEASGPATLRASLINTANTPCPSRWLAGLEFGYFGLFSPLAYELQIPEMHPVIDEGLRLRIPRVRLQAQGIEAWGSLEIHGARQESNLALRVNFRAENRFLAAHADFESVVVLDSTAFRVSGGYRYLETNSLHTVDFSHYVLNVALGLTTHQFHGDRFRAYTRSPAQGGWWHPGFDTGEIFGKSFVTGLGNITTTAHARRSDRTRDTLDYSLTARMQGFDQTILGTHYFADPTTLISIRGDQNLGTIELIPPRVGLDTSYSYETRNHAATEAVSIRATPAGPFRIEYDPRNGFSIPGQIHRTDVTLSSRLVTPAESPRMTFPPELHLRLDTQVGLVPIPVHTGSDERAYTGDMTITLRSAEAHPAYRLDPFEILHGEARGLLSRIWFPLFWGENPIASGRSQRQPEDFTSGGSITWRGPVLNGTVVAPGSPITGSGALRLRGPFSTTIHSDPRPLTATLSVGETGAQLQGGLQPFGFNLDVAIGQDLEARLRRWLSHASTIEARYDRHRQTIDFLLRDFSLLADGHGHFVLDGQSIQMDDVRVEAGIQEIHLVLDLRAKTLDFSIHERPMAPGTQNRPHLATLSPDVGNLPGIRLPHAGGGDYYLDFQPLPSDQQTRSEGRTRSIHITLPDFSAESLQRASAELANEFSRMFQITREQP